MLLPHLKLERIDISDTDVPKCIFSKDIHSGISHPPDQVDIDKLSKGEIEVISQFLPFVEHQILQQTYWFNLQQIELCCHCFVNRYM
jgi:hypothetical protein